MKTIGIRTGNGLPPHRLSIHLNHLCCYWHCRHTWRTRGNPHGKFCTISFTSCQLKDHKKNYSPFLLEAAAPVWGMDHFNKYLKRYKFICTWTTNHWKNWAICTARPCIGLARTQFCNSIQKMVKHACRLTLQAVCHH